MADKEKVKIVTNHGPMGWVLFMSWIGSVIYFYGQDQSFWGFFLAIFKGAVWPAYVLFYSLRFLGV